MHTARLERLQTALAQANLTAAAVIAGPNLYYLTGLSFHLSERPTVGIFPTQGDPLVIAGNLEQSKITTGTPYPLRAFTYTDSDGPTAAFRAAAQSLQLNQPRIGIETRRMRVMELRLLEDAFPDARIESAEDVFAQLRMAKDSLELNLMRKAVQIAEQALLATLPFIRPGVTERQIASELVIQTLRAGSDAELPFAPIVASGPNSALPHAFVTDRAIEVGDLLTLDWGAATGGYFSDLTRTFAIGQVAPEFEAIYNLVHKANLAAQAATRPGAIAAEVDAAARQVIEAGGYGPYFMHRLGHGLGLEGHEDPSMHSRNELSLEAGMTFTVEPGIYLPGKGGVRIEDDVVVTANGVESLSTLPRDLQVIGV